MKPLILQFAETGINNELREETDYSPLLNLNVIRGTTIPAVTAMNFSTETFTKAQVDTSESDDDFLNVFRNCLDTRLNTRSLVDETGSDDDIRGINQSN